MCRHEVTPQDALNDFADVADCGAFQSYSTGDTYTFPIDLG
jgi:hypothetical protein